VNRVYVHGGVSAERKPTTPSLAHALPVAVAAGTALDAVELAVRALEDDPALNAGTGSVVNLDGEIELDAGIADGTGGRSAGVANVRVRNPVSLARKVLEETPHVLVTGAGAAAFAAGMEALDGPTPEQKRRGGGARGARRRGGAGAAHRRRGQALDEPLDVGAAAARRRPPPAARPRPAPRHRRAHPAPAP
jgi:isoaspartyl peptidase/L-asparaginase-like protein (Ntn-hydrolase superfamily)